MFMLLMLAMGCDTGGDSIRGESMAPYFPFDGDREWSFLSEDTTVTYRLLGTELVEETINDSVVYGVEYAKDCFGNDTSCVDGEFVRGFQMSTAGGIFVHSFEDNSGKTTFDPPVQIAASNVFINDEAVTDTDGQTFTSTYNGTTDCPVKLNANWDGCAHFTVTTSGNSGFAGELYALPGYGIVAFDMVADNGMWQLDAFEDNQ